MKIIQVSMSEVSKDPGKRMDVSYWMKKMEEKGPKKKGRPSIPKDQKKLLISAYLTKSEIELINTNYGNLTEAVRKIILPQLK